MVAASLLMVMGSLAIAQPDEWPVRVISDRPVHPSNLAIVDFDGDGREDILSETDDDVVRWWRYDGATDQWYGDRLAVAQLTDRTLTVGDYDGDGDLDFAGSGNFLGWWENTPGGFLQRPIDTDWYARDLESADIYTGDGRDELIAYLDTPGEDGIAVLSITDDGIMTEFVANPVPYHGKSLVEVTDWDQDGRLDIVYSEGFYEPDNASLKLARNDPDGWLIETVHSGDNFTFLDAVDIDEDGDTDMLVHAHPDSGGYGVLLNTGEDHLFGQFFGYSTGWESIVPMDVDFDGDLDIVANYNQTAVWWEQEANGDFVTHDLEGEVLWESTWELAVCDFDGDGDDDLIRTQLFPYLLTTLEQAGPVFVSLEPLYDPPYTVWPGGEIEFTLVVENTLAVPVSGVIWADAIDSDGQVHGPLASVPMSLVGLQTRTFPGVIQQVPAAAEPGYYQFRVHVGDDVGSSRESDRFEVLIWPEER